MDINLIGVQIGENLFTLGPHFEGLIWVPFASVPDLCILFSFRRYAFFGILRIL